MKWWMMPPLLVALALPAAAQNEQFQMDKPLTAQQALQLMLFESVLSQIRYEIDHGRDPMKLLVGKTPIELLGMAAERLKAERAAAAAKSGAAAPSANAPAPDADFPVKNTRVLAGAKARLVGEITNNSGRGLQAATFSVRFFNAAHELLGTSNASIREFAPGQTKSFAASLAGIRPELVKSYKVEFESGQ